jgi:hypothetical protein
MSQRKPIAALLEEVTRPPPPKRPPERKRKKKLQLRRGPPVVKRKQLDLEEEMIRRFCHALLFECGFNATDAYLKVDPTVTRGSAGTIAARLLRSVRVQSKLAEIINTAKARDGLDQAKIIAIWNAMSDANILDYYDEDKDGRLVLTKLKRLPIEKQQNIAQIEVTTDTINDMTVQQRVKLKLIDRKSVTDSMARAAGMFGDLGKPPEDDGDIAKAIEEGFERVRKAMGGKTFDGKTGEEVIDV